ncbi:hypothetical protein DNTS_031578 [Danionella cerebrum]|uniref:TBC1 domain family member 2A n=1 Tax=Danionella cerebrum TaxID=2873325 RepID=A0A553QJF9_9TELE|nr:hypothetical protein DNTS_031578 [Danionella translucida]
MESEESASIPALTASLPKEETDPSFYDAQQNENTHVDQQDGTCGTPTPSTPSSAKLCGYLHKQGGPLRTWKFRWFAFEEKSCQLFYFRMATDINPLGKVDLTQATFSYPVHGEEGTFHIQSPERTVVLKAANRDVQMYWIQQLQLKRTLFRETQVKHQCLLQPNNQSVESRSAANKSPANFLPMLKTPSGLVGEEAASLPAPGLNNPLNMSLKHPLIELQNTVHNFLHRHPADIRQSVFHIDDLNDSSKSTSSTITTGPSSESPANAKCEEPQQNPSSCSPQNKRSSSEKRKALDIKDTFLIHHENLSLAGEVKAQKELVLLLHKVLEAAQLEKRTCAQFLAADGEQERLELLRHGERRVVELRAQLASVQQENESLRRDLTQRDNHVTELQKSVQLLLQKNQSKQEDDLKAYKIQNQYLNSEIYQLTMLWRKSSEQEKSLIVKCAVMEANNSQMESRYLGFLQELQESQELNSEQREAVRNLVKDVVQEDLIKASKLNPISEYDEYGFRIGVDYKIEDLKLLATVQALELRSQNLPNQEECDGSMLARCAQLLSGRPEGELSSSGEMKALLRAGLPLEYRARVWRFMIQTRTKSLRERHPGRYQELCEKSRSSPHLVPRQIQLDLDRTLTSNKHFCPPSRPLIEKLERVLQAFSWHNPTIGYVQGLNRLAAIALLVLQDEEEAFWCLLVIIEHIMPQNYYTKDLVGCRADQRVLRDLMYEKLPRLSAHLQTLRVDISLITVEWFLVLFVDSLPSRILFKIWDAFFCEGSKYREEAILKIQDSVEMKLSCIAFNDINPLPMRLIKNRRAAHVEHLLGEITELENLQKAYKAQHVQCRGKQLDLLTSDDDEEEI